MNRADLTWALNAIIPHCGSSAATDRVCIASRLRGVFLYATDRYTIGVARIEAGAMALGDTSLTGREATELLRFVRPAKAAERTEPVEMLTAPGELHVATENDSAVFETVPATYSFRELTGRLAKVESLPPYAGEEQVFNPDITSRFAKAKRDVRDVLRLNPRTVRDLFGVALVTVGSDFYGAVAGIQPPSDPPTSLSDFLGELESAA